MSSKDKDIICYELLMKVFRDNAYASIELNSALNEASPGDGPYITKLFYGVLERSVYYDYVLSRFAKDKPKKPIAVIVKMGYYILDNISVPAYAAVNNMVLLCKKVGKGGASGFVNSALRNYSVPALPAEGSNEYLSVKYSYPLWLVKILVSDYGYDFTRDMLSYEPDKRIHIRVNTHYISQSDFALKYADLQMEKCTTGYYVTHDIIADINKRHYAVQSAASVAAVKAYLNGAGRVKTVLDLCAAPGGKAVLIAESTGAEVTACDIHPHRVELIRKYADGCGVKVNSVLNDATVFNSEWKDKFDLVVCDVPCSGIGVAGSRPDILFNRNEGDIDCLTEIQHKILRTACKYVAPGGRLCYSTCTVLRRENSDAIVEFLYAEHNFVREEIVSPLDGKKYAELNLYPHINHTDGFYVSVLKRER